METVKIEKLVHGGQGLGTLADGRKVFVWNSLPGEEVAVRLIKGKRSYAEGIAEEILKASSERIEPKDEAYLSTSPWQIMQFAAENKYKKDILSEAFSREHVELPKFDFVSEGEPYQYRNKMEYSFWADDDGLHLALFQRGTHGKQIVRGSSIARPEIDETANKICVALNQAGIRGSQLKTVIVRCNQAGETVAAVFVKDQKFPKLDSLEGICRGLVIYYSNPKSPASVLTKKLYKFGDLTLSDTIAGKSLSYGVNSFFQVNVPVFEKALQQITAAAKGQKKIIDMYAGVGTIGIAVGAQVLVELDEQNTRVAAKNATEAQVVQASSEQSLQYITADATMIFDPPRAGLHDKVTDRILEVLPTKIIYLSCNPATQARDVARLQAAYTVTAFTGYNFFPRTPHIESLAILEKR